MQMPWKPDQLSLCRWQQRWSATPSSNSRWHRWHRWHLILLKDAQCRELLELLQDLCDQRGVKAVDVDLRLQGTLPRINFQFCRFAQANGACFHGYRLQFVAWSGPVNQLGVWEPFRLRPGRQSKKSTPQRPRHSLCLKFVSGDQERHQELDGQITKLGMLCNASLLQECTDDERSLLWEMFVGAKETFLHGLQTSKIPVIEVAWLRKFSRTLGL
jgi:hypothetical protein